MSGTQQRRGKAVLVLDDGRTFTGTTFGAVGQTLGDEALRRADEEDALLPPTPAAYESYLLAAVLGVVPGIGLVRDQVRQGDRQNR